MGNIQSSFIEQQVFPKVKNAKLSDIDAWLKNNSYVLEKNVFHYTPFDSDHKNVCFVYLHGNAEDALSVDIFKCLKCSKLIAYEYPGYGVRQKETISEQKCIDGVQEMATWLTENIPKEKSIVVCGRSLGTFFATRLAHLLQKRCKALILVSPMVSAIATKIPPPFHKMFYMADMINTEHFIDETFSNPGCKTLILHGTHDEIVPVSHAEHNAHSLRKKNTVVEVKTVQNAGHNDIFQLYTLNLINTFIVDCFDDYKKT